MPPLLLLPPLHLLTGPDIMKFIWWFSLTLARGVTRSRPSEDVGRGGGGLVGCGEEKKGKALILTRSQTSFSHCSIHTHILLPQHIAQVGGGGWGVVGCSRRVSRGFITAPLRPVCTLGGVSVSAWSQAVRLVSCDKSPLFICRFAGEAELVLQTEFHCLEMP